MRNTFVNTIIEEAKRRDDVFIISGDAGLGVFDDYQRSMSQRFLNLGVAEQNAVSFCAGMALAGYKMYLYNIIPFLLYRCYEQVRNDICYQNLPVVLSGIGSGITYAPQGMTHYSVEDIGLCRTLPNLRVISPIDPVESEAAARYSLCALYPVYVRLAKRGEPPIHKDKNINIELPQVLRKGKKIAFVTHGSVAPEVVSACSILEADGYDPELISLPLVQPLNEEALLPLLEGFEDVVCVEEHWTASGLGNSILTLSARKRRGWRVHVLGIPDKFIHEIKDIAGMRKHFGIDAKGIAGYVKGLYTER